MKNWDRRPTQRKDALFHEAFILFEIYNVLITMNATGWEVTQTELADHLRIGERTVQRVTERLEKMGRLSRAAGQGQSSYIYSLAPKAIAETMLDIVTKSNLFFVQDVKGRIYLTESFEEYWNTAISDDSKIVGGTNSKD